MEKAARKPAASAAAALPPGKPADMIGQSNHRGTIGAIIILW
jgi:hypothetical protein